MDTDGFVVKVTIMNFKRSIQMNVHLVVMENRDAQKRHTHHTHQLT